MACVDFVFYQNEYNGTQITDFNKFTESVRDAQAFIDSLVLNRDMLKHEGVKRKYYFAICAAAECEAQIRTSADTAVKSSESVGNHSISYHVTTNAEIQTEKREKALYYLRNTGLLSGVMR